MAWFKNNPQGGIMDVIRCDETGYLIWKWHPKGTVEGESAKENAIRLGSSLRVKSGEAAVFVYHSNGEQVQDYIVGPYDSILTTENLPLISSVIGLAYNGNTPFQAEVYFVNLAQILQVKIGVPYFDVADSRFPDRGVPTSVRGVISFKITDIEDFIKKYQLRTISIEEFRNTIKAATAKYVKNVVVNAPDEYGIPVTQLEKKLLSEDIDYSKIKGLRLEARQKLNKIKPYSIGQASRISGVSPADISVLLIYLEQLKKKK